MTQLNSDQGPFMTEYLNLHIVLSKLLAAPVRGLLAPSYLAAVARAQAQPQAAAAGLALAATIEGGASPQAQPLPAGS